MSILQELNSNMEIIANNKTKFFNKENITHIFLSLFFIIVFRLIYMAPLFVVPDFKEIYSGFGQELSFLTKFIISNYLYYPLIQILVYLSYFYYFIYVFRNGNNQRLFRKISLVNLFICAVIMSISIVFLYLPILSMGGKV